MRPIRLEALEQRALLAVVYADDAYFIEVDQGAPGLDAGDTVTFAFGEPGEVAGLTFGMNAFSTIQQAVTAAAVNDEVRVGTGTFVENVTINKNIQLLSTQGRDFTTIEGVGAGAQLGSVFVTSNTTGLTIGNTDEGFTIIGIDGTPGLEKAAVYFQGPHSNATIRGNDIRANGDHGLLTEFGSVISGFVIDGNIFSGQTFNDPEPGDNGFANQFTNPNVPRQLVTIGGGNGGGNTSNMTFTNNQITGTAGGFNAGGEQGNSLVTFDTNGGTVTGNTFAGTTTRFGSALRVRGPNTVVTGNTFDTTNMTPSTNQVFAQNNNLDDIGPFNDFSSGGYFAGGNTIFIADSIQDLIDNSMAGQTLNILEGTYTENIDVNEAITLGGSFTLVGTLTVSAAGATLSAGYSPGFIDSTDLILMAGTALDVEVDAAGVAGTDYDQYRVTNDVSLGGADLNLNINYVPAFGDSLIIIDNQGANPVGGTFDALPNGALVPGTDFRIFYNGGDGNDVVLLATNAAPAPAIVYVDDNFANPIPGQDPDGAGPATAYLVDSFPTIQEGVNAVAVGGTVIVYAGVYVENVTVNKTLDLIGPQDGVDPLGRTTPADEATISVPAGGTGITLTGAANGVEIRGFTVQSDNVGTPALRGIYEDTTLVGTIVSDNIILNFPNSLGVSFATGSSGGVVDSNQIEGSYAGVYLSTGANNVTITNNLIQNNPGLIGDAGSAVIFEGNNTNVTVTNNDLLNNNNGVFVFTGFGDNFAGTVVHYNRIEGNTAGVLNTGPTTIDVTRNWWGDISGPTTLLNPGGSGDIIVGLATFSPWLVYNNEDAGDELLTGFQLPAEIDIAGGSNVSAADNDYRRIANAVGAVADGQTINLSGIFDWVDAIASASWALGTDGIAATDDDYSAEAPANVNDVTITAAALGDATIQGPGDLAAVNLEGVFVFNGGDNQNWEISNLEILDFDLAIGMFDGAGGTDAYDGTRILNNLIRVASDLNSTVAPIDTDQNIGIHFSFGKNQTIQGNRIEFYGDGVNDGGLSASSVGMQSNIGGGDTYDGLLIDGNTLVVLNAQSATPERIIGIWENGDSHTSNITVSNNSFTNLDPANDPTLNNQQAFRYTSHSSLTTMVLYEGNTVSGATFGIMALNGQNFSGNQPIQFINNTLTGNNVGLRINSNALGTVSQNTITGNLDAGLLIEAGEVSGGGVTFAVGQNFISGNGDNIRIEAAGVVNGQISLNDLSGATNLGINNVSGTVVNASGNWWGSNVEADVAATAGADVDFTPYLDNGTDFFPVLDGFQNDLEILRVSDLGEQVGPDGRVQEGVDNAETTVILEGGTYVENVDVNRPITLTGDGAIDGSLTLSDADAVFAPGATTTVFPTGDLTLIADSTLTLEVDGLIAGTEHDQVDVTGGVDVTDAVLDITLTGTYTGGDEFILINNDGGDAVVGEFALAPEGATLILNGQAFVISYVGGDGNDVVLTRVNNDDPVSVDDFYAIDEDGVLIVPAPGVLDNDSDPDGDPLTVLLVSQPTNGTLIFNADGSFTYTPDPDFNGVDTFQYRPFDGVRVGPIATVEITVNSVNDDPIAVDDDYTMDEDGVLIVPAPGVLDNDSDVDGDMLTVTIDTLPTNGVAVLNPDGSFTYTPDPDFFGVDSFTYTVDDGNGGSATATVTITVNNVNDDPIAVDDDYAVDEDNVLTVPAPGVLDNDSDVDGDTLTVTIDTLPTNGVVVLNPDGSFTYTPDADYNGPDSFTYTVDDGNGGTATATVNITVNAVNDDPVAVDDNYDVDEDNDLNIPAPGVLDNDSDVDGDTLTVQSHSQPANGVVVVFADGSFTYIPNPDFNGVDSFTYTVSDGNGGTAIGTVTITVNTVNDDPVAVDDDYAVNEDGSLVVTVPGVLVNDTDVDGDTLTVTLDAQPANGVVVLNADGSFTYTPDADYFGVDTFTYTVDDGNGGTDTATVTITVNPVQDAPVAVNDVYNLDQDTPLVVPAPGVLDNDTDADGDTLTAAINTQPGNGTVVLNADGSFTYTPDAGFFGTDQFTYIVSDGNGGTAIGTVDLLVAQIQVNPQFPVKDGDLITGDSTNDTFVRNLYEDVLDRDPDAMGLANWLAALAGGATREEIANEFVTSEEYLTNLVTAMYGVFLNRAPDAGGLAYFVDILEDGASEPQVASIILGSDEFFTNNGGTTAGFVEGLYQALLGRTADAGGLTFWSSRVDEVGRQQAAFEMMQTEEFRSLLLDDAADDFAVLEGWYQDYFDGADAISMPGKAGFLADLATADRWSDVQAAILATDEYFEGSV